MALEFFDGFDFYDGATCNLSHRGWNNGSGSILYNQVGRFPGSRAMQIIDSRITPPMTPTDTVAVGFAVKIPSAVFVAASTGTAFMQFTNATIPSIVRVGVDVNGKIVVGRTDLTTTKIGEGVAGDLVPDVWNYVEVELVRHASAGTVAVYVNGALRVNLSGVNTGAAAVDRITVWGSTSNYTMYDDLYVKSDATRLGEVRVESLSPSADTAQKDWTPLSGTTNFSMVDDRPTNLDTDYVSSGTVGAKDLYDLANLGNTPSSVYGVNTILVARKDDALTRAVRTNLKSGSTTVNGTTRALAATYVLTADMLLNDPDTSAAWTGSAVNATQLGIEVVT